MSNNRVSRRISSVMCCDENRGSEGSCRPYNVPGVPMPGSSTVHGDEEFVVVACAAHLVEQELHGLDRIHVGGQLPQNPDTRQPCLGNELLLAARARVVGVDGGPDTNGGQSM